MDSALVLIIAKIIAIVEASLDSFVTVTLNNAVCVNGVYYPASAIANMQCDGLGLASNIEASIAVIAALIPALLQGLTVAV